MLSIECKHILLIENNEIMITEHQTQGIKLNKYQYPGCHIQSPFLFCAEFELPVGSIFMNFALHAVRYSYPVDGRIISYLRLYFMRNLEFYDLPEEKRYRKHKLIIAKTLSEFPEKFLDNHKYLSTISNEHFDVLHIFQEFDSKMRFLQ